jgi:hypothetical protein
MSCGVCGIVSGSPASHHLAVHSRLGPARVVASLLVAGLLALSGCGSALANASAEPTRCPTEYIQILDVHQPMEGPSSWTALCRVPGAEPKQFFCSRAGEAHRVICTDVPDATLVSPGQ